MTCAYCDTCGSKLGDTPYGTLDCYSCAARREVTDLRVENERLRAFAFGDAPEWEKANCSLKHEARELRAERDAAVRERDEARDTAKRATDLAERYGEAIVAISDALPNVNKARVIIAALAVPAPPTTTEKNDE